MIIIGAGMSGLLAGALNPGSLIYEAGHKREDHKAVFRCKSPEIGKVLGIPFKEVEVHKAIWLDGEEVQPSPRIAHMYSQKVSGTISNRSIFNIDPGKRYIPPGDFLSQLRNRCTIMYDTVWNFNEFCVQDKISTIPLYAMCGKLGINQPYCDYEPIYVNQFEIEGCNSYCTVYYPGVGSCYRATLNGNTLITEGMSPLKDYEVSDILVSFGIPSHTVDLESDWKAQNHKQKFGKITPIDNAERRQLILELSLKYDIYSLGRFATWRPKVMLDDVLEDIYVIRRLMSEGKYSATNHKQQDMD